ncbi:MAG: hypothetical protein L0G99_00500 [Propionibacteriales bacterium]|nr:hypothetical protein [Propionibacteriales bacterium]
MFDDLRPGLVPMHGIASRQNLPLPFEFVVIGAALALLISFILLFVAWRRPRFTQRSGLELGTMPRSIVWIARLGVLALFGLLAAALVAGEDRITNPVFGWVYAIMWVGVVPLSLVLGPIWKALNPIRTVHLGLCALLRIDPAQGLVTLPRGVGAWPACLGLLVFSFMELVQPNNTTLEVLRFYAAIWFATLMVGAIIFGSRWIAAADPFDVYGTFIAAGSPVQVGGDQVITVMNPLRALATWKPPPGSVLVAAALLGSTAFDSFSNTTFWISNATTADPYEPLGTLGLLGFVSVVGITFCAASMAMNPWTRKGAELPQLPRLMSGTVAPIIVGYAMAHYLSLLVVEGQRTFNSLSDPLGRGWNLFGTAEGGVNTFLFDFPTVSAVIQLVAIVGGHVIGIISAHERSLAVLRSDAAVVGQIPMLAVMVFYTCSGLLLLFSP